MVADVQIAVGRGHAGASLSLDRSPRGARSNLLLAAVCGLLTLPFTVGLALSAAGAREGLLGLLTGGAHPGPARLLQLGPPVALIILAAARLRVGAERGSGRWVGHITARLDRWELVIAVLALLVVGLFGAHLVADGLACANGVTHAC